MSRLGRRLISAVYDVSGIETRHTVISEFDASAIASEAKPVFFDASTGSILIPTTGARNDFYVEQSPELFLTAARRALESAQGFSASDVTHVVTVPCTGFFAPGPDYAIVRGLGLDPSTQRYHLGFMGCCAAFPAMRAARSFCQADPDAVVLVVWVELCTIHLHSSNDPDTILASSVFSDGAAAAVVSARDPEPEETVLDLDAFETVLTRSARRTWPGPSGTPASR